MEMQYEEYGCKQSDMLNKQLMDKLKEMGINIDKNDYYLNSRWKELELGFILHKVSVTEAWWIEKNIVGQDRLLQIYGPYALGVAKQLTDEELQESTWFNYILAKYNDKNYTYADIYKYFYRNEEKGKRYGLVKRLQQIGINVALFDDKREYTKLLYFLFCFEHTVRDNGKTVELMPFLSNPTLENVDNALVGDYTKNGSLMAEIKRNVAKEVDENFIFALNQIMVTVIRQWEGQIACVMSYLDYSVNGEYLDELERICTTLEADTGMVHSFKGEQYNHSLLETVYLKLAEHETIGRELDLMDINDYTVKYMNGISEEKLFEYKRLAYKRLNKTEVVSFLTENRKKIAPLVFEKEKVSSNDYKKYDTAIERVNNYIQVVNENTKLMDADELPQLFVICCMQEVIQIDKNEKINNGYYRHDTNEIKTLNTELNNGTKAKRKSQLALIGRANKRFYVYAGKEAESNYAKRAEKAIDKIIHRIFQADNLIDMAYMHNFFMMAVDSALVADSRTENNKKSFMKAVKRVVKGYQLVGDSFMIQGFFATINNTSIPELLGKKIGKEIFKLECDGGNVVCEKSWFFDLTDNYINETENYMLRATIDTINKRIIIHALFITPSGEYGKRLQANKIG